MLNHVLNYILLIKGNVIKYYTRFIENLDKSDRLCLFQYTPLKEFEWDSVVNQRWGDWAIVTRGQGGAVW